MKVTIWGAGAIGGVTGAALARAGHDVTLVDVNAEHVAAMNTSGLTIECSPPTPGTPAPVRPAARPTIECSPPTPGTPAPVRPAARQTIESVAGESTVPVHAHTPDQIRRPLDLVFLAVKSHHTAGALDMLVPHLAPQATVVSLQNGLNEETIADRIGAARTVGCLVNWGADWLAPGRIQWGGGGAFVVGELDGAATERLAGFVTLLGAVAEARSTSNIWGYKWAKHVYGALLFATALVDADVHDVVERSEPIQRALIAVVVEGLAVAKAAGIRIEPFDEFDPQWYWAADAGDDDARRRAIGAIASHYRAHTKTKTGVWRDLAVRKRKTEVDPLVGATAERGRRLGIATPLTTRLVELIHDVEDGRRPMSWATLEELVAAHDRRARS